MKKFSLEEFQKNPNRKVVTRDRKATARIICTDCKSEYPVIALLSYSEHSEGCEAYTKDGRFSIDGESNSDLFFAPEKKVIWGNLYSTQLGTTFSGDFYKTEEAALKEKAKDFSKYITTFKVEWEE